MQNFEHTLKKCFYESLYACCVSTNSIFFICWKSFLKILGILLVIFFYILVTLILYFYFFDTCKLYFFVYHSYILTLVKIH